jgi:hypothetical protein
LRQSENRKTQCFAFSSFLQTAFYVAMPYIIDSVGGSSESSSTLFNPYTLLSFCNAGMSGFATLFAAIQKVYQSDTLKYFDDKITDLLDQPNDQFAVNNENLAEDVLGIQKKYYKTAQNYVLASSEEEVADAYTEFKNIQQFKEEDLLVALKQPKFIQSLYKLAANHNKFSENDHYWHKLQGLFTIFQPLLNMGRIGTLLKNEGDLEANDTLWIGLLEVAGMSNSVLNAAWNGSEIYSSHVSCNEKLFRKAHKAVRFTHKLISKLENSQIV